MSVDINLDHDLALIEISTDKKLPSVPVKPDGSDIGFGEPIYVAANPQHLFRSLKRGIISSPLRIVQGSPSFEIDAGVIFGSSGGAVLTPDGELIGVVKSMRVIESLFCYDLWNEDGEHAGQRCAQIPLSFIGFAARPEMIREFIRHSIFCEDFNYQCVKAEDSTETTTDEQEKVNE